MLARVLLAALLLFSERGPWLLIGRVPDRNPYGCTASTSGTYVGPSGSITDASCGVWTLGSGTTPNIIILRNGSPASAIAKGSVIEYYLSQIYVKGTDDNWYLWDGSEFNIWGSSDPSMAITPVGYFVSTSGNNANSCMTSTNSATPKRTLNSAITCLTPGSTLWVRGGTYTEALLNVVPSGTSWVNKVRIVAYPGETVTMAPTSGNYVLYFATTSAYIEFDGINTSGAVLADASIFFDDRTFGTPNHIRIQNATIAHRNDLGGGNTNAAILVAGHDNEFINLDVSGVGGPYGIYLHGDNNLVDRCYIHDVASAFVQIYHNASADGYTGPPNGTVVRNTRMDNIVTSNQFGVADGRLWGVLIYGALNSKVYNNTITRLGLPYLSGNVAIGILGNGSRIWNNTVYSNTTEGITVTAGSLDTVVQNNIVYLNSGGNYSNGAGGQTSHTNNLEGIDPIVVDATARNFRLQSTSPARDTGVCIPSVFTTDLDGTPRPQGPTCDAGAFEYH